MATLDKKGKHLTQENRINILNELIKGTSLSEIVLKLSKDVANNYILYQKVYLLFDY